MAAPRGCAESAHFFNCDSLLMRSLVVSLTPLKVPGQKVVIFKGNVSGSAATAGLPLPRRVCLLRAGTLAQRGTPPFHPPVFRGFFFNFWSKISALLIVAKMVCFPGFPWGWWWWGLAQNVGCQAVPPRAAPRHSQTLLPDPANRICFSCIVVRYVLVFRLYCGMTI